MNYKNYVLLIIVSVFHFANVHAQPGKIDTSFNPLDSGYWKGHSLNDGIKDGLIQSDGKIIIAGRFTNYYGSMLSRIARLNSDGSLDKTFNTGTIGPNPVNKVVLQNNGKIIISGGFSSVNNIQRNGIARLNTDGSLDLTFNPGTGFNNLDLPEPITGLVVQADGKILATGAFTTYNGSNNKSIVRILANGDIDSTFQTGMGVTSTLNAIALQNDGKILIASRFATLYDGVNINGLARLNANGTLDNSFVSNSNYSVNTLCLQSDGKIILGTFDKINLLRLNIDRTIDKTFTVDSSGRSPHKIIIQNDGKLIIARSSQVGAPIITEVVRFNLDGNSDPTFSSGIVNSNAGIASVETILLQNDGKIILGGVFSYYNDTIIRNYIARIQPNGAMDNNAFTVTGLGVNGNIWTIALQDDGKILAGGFLSAYNGVIRSSIVRINKDGSIDNSFNAGKGPDYWTETIVLQKDGKILVGGLYQSFDGKPRYGLVRLNTDGSEDMGFVNVFDRFSQIESILVQSDGKIVVGGILRLAGKTIIIARLLPNGTLDASFKIPEANYSISGMALQTDGKIIINGLIWNFNSVNANGIVRLNTDGTLDSTFQTAAGANTQIWKNKLQDDGKIIICGQFSSFAGTMCNGIARLNTDGTLDSTFQTGTGADAMVYTTSVQKNGKLIIGGGFTFYDGTAVNRIACLNTDGSLDKTFDVGTGANDFVTFTTLQKDGQILVGGYFSAYNGTGRNSIMRLNGNNIVGIDKTLIDRSIQVYPNPTSGLFNLRVNNSVEVTITDVTGKLVYKRKSGLGIETIDLSKESNGMYFIDTRSENGRQSGKLIIAK
jgi:uncharacterized delta-60 repeat protein